MSPQMSRILQGVIVPKSDVLFLSTESKQQQQMFSVRKRNGSRNFSKDEAAYLSFLNFNAVEIIVQ
ncbi:hypothetical protein ABNX05_05535 [Lysinibacillus sp. M3]|uniref:Uncharacterized protein n=1 Tax=Lysinibacillus zambalensis TaxID=3160866 RepID=A0ABV1MNH8_9BACI